MTRQLQAAWILLVCGSLCLIAGVVIIHGTQPTFAQTADEVTGDNQYCLVCHANTDQTIHLDDGAELRMDVDVDTLNDSVHGETSEAGSLGCVDCHGEYPYPHVSSYPSTHRAYTIQASLICTNCHEDKTVDLADSVHYTALQDGNVRAATCVDCHGAHDIQPPNLPRTRISETCGSCHRSTFAEYRQSVHGEALFDGDPNVPTCVDCHGVHGIENPTTALFRNRSPQLCAECHGDEALMAEYGISTNVFDSYLTDFHGSTVALFHQDDPNVASNKAVCYDCHGVHNIAPVDDAKSQVVRENLLSTCQQCHPDATSNFPDSWVGHFEPTLDSHPILYLVNLFYIILIPVVIGGFGLLISTDVFRMIRERIQG